MPSEPTNTTEVETPTTQSPTAAVTDHDKDHATQSPTAAVTDHDKDHDLSSYTEETHPSSIPSAAIASSIHTSSIFIVIITILLKL